MANGRPTRRRPPSYRRIKQGATYEVAEVAKLVGVHRNTVRQWLKAGLPALDDRRPLLVHGAALKVFLAERRKQRRRTCRSGEFYCFRCRAPRAAWGATADVRLHSAKVAKLTALCAICGTSMHKAARRSDLPALAATLDLHAPGPERLIECSRPTADRDFEKDGNNG